MILCWGFKSLGILNRYNSVFMVSCHSHDNLGELIKFIMAIVKDKLLKLITMAMVAERCNAGCRIFRVIYKVRLGWT